jgi:hypothetical protein
VHKVPAVGLAARNYFHSYTDDAVDFCDMLSSFAPGAKAGLQPTLSGHGIARKARGADVDPYFREGRIRENRRLLRKRRGQHYRV